MSSKNAAWLPFLKSSGGEPPLDGRVRGRHVAKGIGIVDLAEHIIRQTITHGAATALGEDNRYFHSERKGFGPRALYAIESTFLTHRPGGKRRFAYSRLVGTLATAFISREWQPHSTNGAQNAWSLFASSTGTEVGFNVALELLPNIFRH